MGRKIIDDESFGAQRERQRKIERDVAIAGAEIDELISQLGGEGMDRQTMAAVREQTLAAIEQYEYKFGELPKMREEVEKFRQRFQAALREKAA